MKDAILIAAVLGIFVFGYFVMGRLDKFLNENRKAIKKENEKREPSCIMLTEEASDAEIASEIKRFRKSHETMRIFMYDGTVTEHPDGMQRQNDRKG